MHHQRPLLALAPANEPLKQENEDCRRFDSSLMLPIADMRYITNRITSARPAQSNSLSVQQACFSGDELSSASGEDVCYKMLALCCHVLCWAVLSEPPYIHLGDVGVVVSFRSRHSLSKAYTVRAKPTSWARSPVLKEAIER